MDHPVLSGTQGADEAEWFGPYRGPKELFLECTLQELRDVAIETNLEWSEKLGIKQSVAITCVN